MKNVSMYWGFIEVIEEKKVRVKTRTIITEPIDVMVLNNSDDRTSSSKLKKGDPILVISVGLNSVGFVGRPSKKLELDEGVIEQIIFKEGMSLKIVDKKLEIEGFDEVSTKSKGFKVVADKIEFGSKEIKTGVVTRECLCAFTGLPHPQASIEVTASK